MTRAGIQAHARNWRVDCLGVAADADAPACEILSRLTETTGVRPVGLPAGDPLLAGALAVYDAEAGAIWVRNGVEESVRSVYVTHEYAHYLLHSGSLGLRARTLELLSDENSAESIVGYSPRQRREIDTDTWASELLLPEPVARRLLYEQKRSAYEIAKRLQLPEEYTRRWLRRVLLTPEASADKAVPEPSEMRLDSSQEAAARVERGPFLLAAGPGTGKTRTMVARCRYLCAERGARPESILVLTFSRKAAAQVRERLLTAGVGSPSAEPWTGTFHSFALEILRRFGPQAGLLEHWRIASSAEARNRLQEGLLWAETPVRLQLPLSEIMRAISCAKDELCSAEEYAALARESQGQGASDTEPDGFGQVAEVYRIYQRMLRENQLLDFGDLLTTAVDLLERDQIVRMQLQEEFKYIVVDEYQDMNRASARLLRLLSTEDAAGLWVVGDHRQSIYRFRGASAANIAGFQKDFPGAALGSLDVNYRSTEEIVRLVGAVARRQSAAEPMPFQEWRASRPPAGRAKLSIKSAVAADDEAQADGIAQEMRELVETGWRFTDIAVLCRSNAQALLLADLLRSRGVPVRDSVSASMSAAVKDALCVLSLFQRTPPGDPATLLRAGAVLGASDPDGLMERVLSASGTDPLVAKLLADEIIRRDEPQFCANLSALAESGSACGVLDELFIGRVGNLRRIAADTSDPGSGHEGLQSLRRLYDVAAIADQTVSDAKRAGSPLRRGPDPFSICLSEMRRAWNGTRVAGAEGEGVDDGTTSDSVQVITVHQAKGLEFPVVFIPYLSQGLFPTTKRSERTELLEAAGRLHDGSAYLDEESCLFFVAISRARDRLILSRSECRVPGGRALKPSPFLRLVGDLPTITWQRAIGSAGFGVVSPRAKRYEPQKLVQEGRKQRFRADDLSLYSSCPRRYYYQVVRRLEGSAGTPRYRRWLGALVEWAGGKAGAARSPSVAELRQKAVSLAYSPYESCQSMLVDDVVIDMLVEEARSALHIDAGPKLSRADGAASTQEIELGNGIVTGVASARALKSNEPMQLEIVSDQMSIGAASFSEWLKMFKMKWLSEPNPPIIAAIPGIERSYEAAIEGILAQRFDPSPAAASQCRTCPFLLICPT